MGGLVLFNSSLLFFQAIGQAFSPYGMWKEADPLFIKAQSVHSPSPLILISQEAETVGDARTSEECAVFLAFNYPKTQHIDTHTRTIPGFT